MKDRISRWIKTYYAVICLLAIVLMSAAAGSLAAYVNFNSVKRVVSTGSGEAVLFSSNYLYLYERDIEEKNISMRRISPTPIKNTEGNITGYSFVIQVCNYIYGNTEKVNSSEIVYDFNVVLSSADGGNLPDGVSDIWVRMNDGEEKHTFQNGSLTISGRSLPASSPQMDSYSFFIPEGIKDQIRLSVSAVPNESSSSAVNSQKLAAVISLAELKAQASWTGRFIDSREGNIEPKDYDGFNYEISGNGEGKVTLTWDPSILQISPWFQNDVGSDTPKKNENGMMCCRFSVGGANQPSAYRLQFYKTNKNLFNNAGITWDTLSGYVTVEFEEGVNE